jgi:hypothetical protein
MITNYPVLTILGILLAAVAFIVVAEVFKIFDR